VKDSVIVSKEIESLVDKDNIFGAIEKSEIPLAIWCNDSIIYTQVLCANISNGRIKLTFKTKPRLAQGLLICNSINKILIGDEDDKDHLSFKSCEIKSLTITAEEDMYLCRIVVLVG